MIIDINILLAWGAVYKNVNADEIIFEEGTECFYYNQLVSGSVRWVNVDDEGKEYIQTIIDPGECFGVLPLFDDGVYAASAIANENSVLIRLKKEHFLQLIKENQEIHFTITKMLVKAVRFKFLLIKSIAYLSPEKRISALINYLKKEKKHICPVCNQLKLTRQQIADMTGLRVETVIRSMKHMEENGELVIERGKVFL